MNGYFVISIVIHYERKIHCSLPGLSSADWPILGAVTAKHSTAVLAQTVLSDTLKDVAIIQVHIFAQNPIQVEVFAKHLQRTVQNYPPETQTAVSPTPAEKCPLIFPRSFAKYCSLSLWVKFSLQFIDVSFNFFSRVVFIIRPVSDDRQTFSISLISQQFPPEFVWVFCFKIIFSCSFASPGMGFNTPSGTQELTEKNDKFVVQWKKKGFKNSWLHDQTHKLTIFFEKIVWR